MFPQTLLLVAWFAGFAPFVCAADLPFIAAFESAVREEMREWGITGLDIAMVDDQQTIYAVRRSALQSRFPLWIDLQTVRGNGGGAISRAR